MESIWLLIGATLLIFHYIICLVFGALPGDVNSSAVGGFILLVLWRANYKGK